MHNNKIPSHLAQDMAALSLITATTTAAAITAPRGSTPPPPDWTCLPVELASIIFSHLSPADLKSIRLVCKNSRFLADHFITALVLDFRTLGRKVKKGSSPRHRHYRWNSEKAACMLDAQRWRNTKSVEVGGLDDNGVADFFTTVAGMHWPRLQSLRMDACSLTHLNETSSVRDAHSMERLEHLTSLALPNCGLRDDNVFNFIFHLRAPLVELDLSQNLLNFDEDVDSRPPPSWSKTLRVLSLGYSMYPVNVEKLIEKYLNVLLPNVTDLDITGVICVPFQNPPTIDPSRTKLTCFTCGNMHDMGSFMHMISVSQEVISTGTFTLPPNRVLFTTNLQYLDVSCTLSQSNQNTFEWLLHLSSIGCFPKLRYLDISGLFRRAGMAEVGLRTGTKFPALETLEAGDLVLDADDVRNIALCYAPALKYLSLRNTTMSWEALDVLMTGQWPELWKLDLGGCRGVHLRRAAESLCENNGPWKWPKLKVLAVKTMGRAKLKPIDRKALLKLLKLWPGLKVQWK